MLDTGRLWNPGANLDSSNTHERYLSHVFSFNVSTCTTCTTIYLGIILEPMITLGPLWVIFLNCHPCRPPCQFCPLLTAAVMAGALEKQIRLYSMLLRLYLSQLSGKSRSTNNYIAADQPMAVGQDL